MNIFDAIRRYWFFLKRIWVLVLGYLFVGILLIIAGCLLKGVVSTILTSIGGSLVAIGLVTVIVEVSTSWHILEIFRVYGDCIEHGLYRVFENTEDNREDNDYRRLYNDKKKKAKKIRVLSLIGGEFLGNDKALAETLAMVKSSKECFLLFAEIDSHGYNYRYKYMEPRDDIDVRGRHTETVSTLKGNLEKLRTEIRNLGSSEKKEVRSYRALPIFKLEFYDDFLFISFYGYNSRAVKESPIFVFKQRGDSKIFRYFSNQFDQYWTGMRETEIQCKECHSL